MYYIKPFKWLILFALLIALLIALFQRTPLKNSELIFSGWIWIILLPWLITLWILSQIFAIKDMRRLLINRYTQFGLIKGEVPTYWYFIPLFIVIISASSMAYYYSIGGYLTDGIVGAVEALIALLPTAIVGVVYFVRGMKKAFKP